ncbi:MAG: hypothetical protein UHE93_00410, partial [Muribaculaceae bacterium]|nr:hypothetical protein [Muribaculaceae bacterium]
CPNFPIFLKLPKLSPSRMGHYGQSRTPGQGQDNGHYPTESNITAILRVVGGSSRVAAISESSERVAKAMSLLSSESSERMPLSPFRPSLPMDC